MMKYYPKICIDSFMVFQATKISCNGKYVDADPNNAEFTNNLKLFTQVGGVATLGYIFKIQIGIKIDLFLFLAIFFLVVF